MTTKRQFQIGLIAWVAAMLAILDTFFNILNPTGSPVWIVYGFGLLFGISAAGAMDVRFNIKWESYQMRVLTIGIMGGAGLIMLQLLGQLLNIVFATTPEQLRILAGVSEEFLFSIAIFGTLYMIAKEKGIHWIWPAISTSIIFALFHYFAYGVQLYAMVILFIGGLIIRWTYVEARDVGAPIIAHLINNGILTIFLTGLAGINLMILVPIAALVVVLLFLPLFLRR